MQNKAKLITIANFEAARVKSRTCGLHAQTSQRTHNGYETSNATQKGKEVVYESGRTKIVDGFGKP
jgi:hypothetical protein